MGISAKFGANTRPNTNEGRLTRVTRIITVDYIFCNFSKLLSLFRIFFSDFVHISHYQKISTPIHILLHHMYPGETLLSARLWLATSRIICLDEIRSYNMSGAIILQTNTKWECKKRKICQPTSPLLYHINHPQNEYFARIQKKPANSRK